MTETILAGPAAVAAAEAVVDEMVAASLANDERARLANAPAGAGKTGAAVSLVTALADADARTGVVAQTNAQAFDLVHRIALNAPGHNVTFLPATGVVLPPDTASLPNVQVAQATQLGNAQTVVATADKWAFTAPTLGPNSFDAGVVDEAYQMPSAKLLRIADLYSSLDFLGDPGQLDPFSVVGDERWRGLATNPVLNAVDALLAHHPGIPRRTIPVTRRLPPSAAGVIREVFYPELAFGPASEPDDRRLHFSVRSIGARDSGADAAWTQAAGTGWAYVQLAPRMAVQPDQEIVATIADLAERLFALGPEITDERHREGARRLAQERVAVGVAHRNQRAATLMALQARGLSGVVVDTANRLQGREFDIVIVWHPLAGRTDATAFHLDSGRAAVLTTRHRHACVVVGRAGTTRLLDDHPPPANFDLGVSRDAEFDGWEAHVRLLAHLETVTV